MFTEILACSVTGQRNNRTIVHGKPEQSFTYRQTISRNTDFRGGR